MQVNGDKFAIADFLRLVVIGADVPAKLDSKGQTGEDQQRPDWEHSQSNEQGNRRENAAANPGQQLSTSGGAQADNGGAFAGSYIVLNLVEVGAKQNQTSANAHNRGGGEIGE